MKWSYSKTTNWGIAGVRWLGLAAACMVSACVSAAEIQGVVQLRVGTEQIGVEKLPPQNRISIALYAGAEQSGTHAPSKVHPVIVKDKILDPLFITIRQGDVLRFINEDEVIYHLRSVSAQNDFDVRLDKKGGQRAQQEVSFSETGSWHLYGELHNSIFGQINVVASSHIKNLKQTNAFRFEGLEPGEWRVEVMTLGSDVVSVTTEAFTSPPGLEIELPVAAVVTAPGSEISSGHNME